MASGNGGHELGTAAVGFLGIIFSLTFPLLVITLAGVSYVMTAFVHAPEFSLWASLALLALNYAKANTWAAIALGVFVLAALPLAWVAFREQEVRISDAILSYVLAGLFIGFTFWLRTAWPYGENGWGGVQIICFGGIMFFVWSAVLEAALNTIGIVAHVRRNRPQPVMPPPQQPHGAPREERRSRSEPETI